MAKVKKESKAKERKRIAKLQMERANRRVAAVNAANSAEDPLQALPSFRKFSKNGLDLNVETTRVAGMDGPTREWLVELLEANMKDVYERAELGWSERNMREEMFEDNAWYLVARENNEGKAPVAYAHFRYEMDEEDEVLYVYEIQLEKSVRRKGLGKFLMTVLELLSHKADMRKIMLTVFKHNPGARKFFKDGLKYERDAANVDDVVVGRGCCPSSKATMERPKEVDYEVLCKINRKKVAREAAEESADPSLCLPVRRSNGG